MGNIQKKIKRNLEARQVAFDSLSSNKKSGYKRPGSMKKKCKQQPGSTK